MTDAQTVLKLWEALKDDPRVDVVKVGKIELRKKGSDDGSGYDLRKVKI